MTDKKMTDESAEQETTISGKAENLKAGAVLMIDDNTPVFIEGMNEWDDDLIGKKMKLTGILRRKQIYPQIKNEGGIISQGMSGTPMVLKLTQPIKR